MCRVVLSLTVRLLRCAFCFGTDLKGFAETRFGAHGRKCSIDLKQDQHNGLKTVRRTVFVCRTDIDTPFRIPSKFGCQKQKAHHMVCFCFWQPNRDSNPNIQSQSLLCYRYTIRLSAFACYIIATVFAFVKSFFEFFKKIFSTK